MKAFNEKWIMAVVEPLSQVGVSKKGQIDTLNRCVRAEVNFINQLFVITA